MGKTLFAAVLAAVLATLATQAVLLSLMERESPEERAAREAVTQRLDTLDEQLATLDRRLERARRDRRAAPSSGPRAPTEAAATGRSDPAPTDAAPPPSIAPDGTPYVSRAELEQALAERAPANVEQVEARRPKPLEDVAAEMGLSSAEEASLRIILRETEEEFVRTLFGDRPVHDILLELRDAQSDPDAQARLMNDVVQNGIRNVGTLMTLEKRRNDRIAALLGEERAQEFESKPVQPILGEEFEDVLGDLFE